MLDVRYGKRRTLRPEQHAELAACRMIKPPMVVRALDRSSPIVVMITTIPSRIAKTKGVLQSLTVQQRIQPDRLIVTIPRAYKRFPNASIEIPDFMASHPYTTILRVDKDYGPATKILGPLLFSDISADTTVIVTDDDTPKLPGWLEYLAVKVQDHPDAIITLSTHPRGEVYGGRGFAFKRRIFDAQEMLVEFERRPECHMIDDDFLTHFCRTRNIPIVKGDARGLFVPESIEFGDKLRDLKGKHHRPHLRGPCARSFNQPSL
jgi:hypothetical protein